MWQSLLNSTISSGVSLDLETSWAAKSLRDALIHAKYDARFQQKQMQEKEEKLIKLYENQQQRTIDRIGARNSLSGGASPVTGTGTGAGKVRQMFDERRQKAGIDRSYPLEPLNKSRNANGYSNTITNRVPNTDRTNNAIPRNNVKTTTTFKSTVQRTITQSKNGKPPTTYGARATAEANYINGELKSGNIQYDITDNGNPLDILKNQERQLELMMNNHRIDDEEFVDCSMDFEEDRGDHFRLPIENGNKENGNKLENGNYRKNISPPATSPVKKQLQKTSYGSVKEKASEKVKPLVKTQSSPAKSSYPSSAPQNSRPQSSTGYQNKEKQQMRAGNRPTNLTSKQSVGPQNRSAASVRGPIGSATPQRDDLKACQYCQRRFATDRITLHEDICAKTLKKKRKTYDPVKHRVQGTDAESFYRKGTKGHSVKQQQAKAPSIGKTDWRRQHEEFISTIRAAKQAQAHIARGGKLSDLPPPPPSYNPDYVQCPHCGRRFNEAAAARHIPKCATMLHNKPNRLAGMQSQTQKKK